MAGYKRERHKPFKGGKSRDSISKRKGRVETKKTCRSDTIHNMSKIDRRNASKIAQKLRHQELTDNSKIFSGINGAPKIVTIIPLSCSLALSESVMNVFGGESLSHNTTIYRSEKFRSNMMFVSCSRKLLDVLTMTFVSDFIMFVVDIASIELDEWARQCLKCLCAQGIPNIIPVLVNSLTEISVKTLQTSRKKWMDFFKNQYSCQKVYDIGDCNQLGELERTIAQHQLKPIRWRDSHPYLVSNNVTFEPKNESGTLILQGYMRGSRAFDTKYPIHISGYGQFHIDRMESVHMNKVSVRKIEDVVMDVVEESNVSKNLNDHESTSLESDQNSFSIEESKKSKPRHKSPKGVSDYQSAWIVESEDESDESSENISIEEEFSTDSSFSVSDQDEDDQDDYTIQEHELMKYRGKLATTDPFEAERNDRDFPDELDTPMDVEARARFKKYCGLKSLRHAKWNSIDGSDEIPEEYSKICQFENASLSEKRALDEKASDLDCSFSVGELVKLYIMNVPFSIFHAIKSSNNPIICFGLLKYEDMVSVLHFTAARSITTWPAPVQSKEQFVMLCGYRRYIVSPIFSEQSSREKNSLYKYIRYLHPERSGIVQHQQHVFGSIYGHVQFGSPPVLLFKYDEQFPEDGSITFCEEPIALVSSGVLDSIDPSKCIIKRVIITGHPFKIHRKTAVVRYMFFNPEDVKYFKPVHIYTKTGKQGRIISSLGTHGYMKCAFDRQLQQQDVVCMNLYRRVFPKWSFKDLPHNNTVNMDV